LIKINYGTISYNITTLHIGVVPYDDQRLVNCLPLLLSYIYIKIVPSRPFNKLIGIGEIRVESGKQSQGTPCFFLYSIEAIAFIINTLVLNMYMYYRGVYYAYIIFGGGILYILQVTIQKVEKDKCLETYEKYHPYIHYIAGIYIMYCVCLIQRTFIEEYSIKFIKFNFFNLIFLI